MTFEISLYTICGLVLVGGGFLAGYAYAVAKVREANRESNRYSLAQGMVGLYRGKSAEIIAAEAELLRCNFFTANMGIGERGLELDAEFVCPLTGNIEKVGMYATNVPPKVLARVMELRRESYDDGIKAATNYFTKQENTNGNDTGEESKEQSSSAA